MKIFYDSQAFCNGNIFGGVANYYATLICNLPRFDNSIKSMLSILSSSNIYAKTLFGVQDNTMFLNNLIKAGIIKSYSKIDEYLLNNNYSKSILNISDFDVFHPTFYDSYWTEIEINKPVIITIHDLIAEKMYNRVTQSFPFTSELTNILNKATRIIAISNQTKNDIIDLYNIPKEKIDVIYHGFDLMPENYEYIKLFEFPYILYVGARTDIFSDFGNSNQVITNYKNFIPFVSQCAKFIERHPNHKIVFTKAPLSVFEQDILRQFNLQDKYVCQNFSIDEMNSLYYYAMCFVFPSEYEGFGLPLFEAFRNQCVALYNANNPVFNELLYNTNIGTEIDFRLQDDLDNQLEWVYQLTQDEKNIILDKQLKIASTFSIANHIQNHIETYKRAIEDFNKNTVS